jgi:hypothetical protein
MRGHFSDSDLPEGIKDVKTTFTNAQKFWMFIAFLILLAGNYNVYLHWNDIIFNVKLSAGEIVALVFTINADFFLSIYLLFKGIKSFNKWLNEQGND